MRLALLLIGLLLFGHCETAVLLQNGGAPTPLQNPVSLCRDLPAVIIPFMLLRHDVVLQRGSCAMESPVSISALHLTHC